MTTNNRLFYKIFRKPLEPYIITVAVIYYAILTLPAVKQHSASSLIVWRNVSIDIMKETRLNRTERWKWREIICPV